MIVGSVLPRPCADKQRNNGAHRTAGPDHESGSSDPMIPKAVIRTEWRLLREQIGQIIRARAANFIDLPGQHEGACPQCLDLRCFGMLLFEFLDTVVERCQLKVKAFDFDVLADRSNWLPYSLCSHDAPPRMLAPSWTQIVARNGVSLGNDMTAARAVHFGKSEFHSTPRPNQ